jgi:hypothetical protein
LRAGTDAVTVDGVVGVKVTSSKPGKLRNLSSNAWISGRRLRAPGL